MKNTYIIYTSIWCPLINVRDYVDKGKLILKDIAKFFSSYGDTEGIIFLELTEDALKNMPFLMVKHMECFSKENIDTMVFCVKELRCKKSPMENFKNTCRNLLSSLQALGFQCETVVVRESRIIKENIGKNVEKKSYKIYYHEKFGG